MNTASPAPVRRSRFRRLGVITLWIVLGVFVFRAGLDLWTRHRLNQEIARLEARYTTIRHTDPERVPDKDNRARAIRAAVSLMSVEYKVLYSPRTAALWNAQPSAPVPSEVRALIGQNEPALRIAEDARQRQKSNWSYERDHETPPLLATRILANLLYAKACMDIEDARADEAARALASSLGVAASLRNEGPLIVQLIRIAAASQAYAGVQRLLSGPEPSAAAMADLAVALEEERQQSPARVGLLGELRWGHGRWAALAEGDAQVFEEGVAGWLGERRPSVWLGLAAWFARPVVTFVHTRFLREVDQLIDAQAVLRPNRVLPWKTQRPGWFGRFDTWMPGFERALDSFDEHAAAQAGVATAIALRRYRLAHGAYPDDLSALAPECLKALPIDPYTGKPPVYSRIGSGFELKAGLPSIGGYDRRPFVWRVSK